MRIIVVGGGVNGLLTSRTLLQAGASVCLVERTRCGTEASWAGGGIISPLYPWRYSPAVTALATWAQAAYPQLADELLASTGIDVELTRTGMLYLDPPDLRDALSWAMAQGHPADVLDAPALHARWPGLPTDVQRGLFMPALAHVRNPRLLKALVSELSGHPRFTLREASPVAEMQARSDTRPAQVILEGGETLRADAVVVCAGAWSARLLAGHGEPLAVRPVRGQMQLYQLAPGALPTMILRGGHYVIPRRDGLVLCGSTVEEAGFDKSVTEVGRRQLSNAASTLWPALASTPVARQWAGLRPGSPNGIPFIGELPGQPGLWVNAGQYRNGLVLAPASARLLADCLLGRPPVLDPAPYRPG